MGTDTCCRGVASHSEFSIHAARFDSASVPDSGLFHVSVTPSLCIDQLATVGWTRARRRARFALIQLTIGAGLPVLIPGEPCLVHFRNIRPVAKRPRGRIALVKQRGVSSRFGGENRR